MNTVSSERKDAKAAASRSAIVLAKLVSTVRICSLNSALVSAWSNPSKANSIRKGTQRRIVKYSLSILADSPPKSVSSRHGLHEASSRWSPSRKNYLQRPDLDPSPCESRCPVPYGGRRDRNRFHRADRFTGHHGTVGARVRFPGRNRSAKGRE